MWQQEKPDLLDKHGQEKGDSSLAFATGRWNLADQPLVSH
jgi:hypothetical protein